MAGNDKTDAAGLAAVKGEFRNLDAWTPDYERRLRSVARNVGWQSFRLSADGLDDFEQVVVVKVFRKFTEGKAGLSTQWMRAVVYSTGCDRARAQAKRVTEVDGMAELSPGAGPVLFNIEDRAAGRAMDVWETLVSLDSLREFGEVLEGLGGRTAILAAMMLHAQGYGWTEIAHEMGVNPSTMRVRVARVRQLLIQR